VKILVCVKRVPDTSARVKPTADGKAADLEGVEHILSPYDEYAMEDALTLVEALGQGEIIAVTIGPTDAEQQLRTCLALGAHRAVLVEDPAAQGGDSLATARVLAAIVTREKPDIVYLGKQATDGDFHAVGAQLATLLDWPFVSATYPIRLEGGKASCERPIEGGVETLVVTLPGVFSAEKARGKEPRYANLKGIMMAKKKPIERLSVSDLGVDPSKVGRSGSRVTLESLERPPERSSGVILKDLPAAEAASKLLHHLREDAKAF
jgi:electron transfer flavoprotein beta subunit